MDKTIRDVIEILEIAPRIGNETDDPEGSRFIIISDTLSKNMVKKLREVTAEGGK